MDPQTRRAWVEVDLDALIRNAVALQAQAQRPLLPMIKADAYGLGAVRVARALSAQRPWGFGVATVAEAADLREAGIAERIVMFTPVLSQDFADLKRLAITPTLSSPDDVCRWGADAPWHLSVDTGMNRAGIEWWRAGEIVQAAHQFPPQGACTHFHSADSANETVALQGARFATAIGQLARRPLILHAENSAAVERASLSPWDVVRPGVFLYGVGGVAGSALQPEPVAHVRARIVELRTVHAGDTVSYGATWQALGARRIATVPLGYADGYRGLFSNQGQALVHGRTVPVVGRVTMDMTMLDVTDVACDVGDVVTVLGTSSGQHIDVNQMAAAVGLLSYELLVGLGLRLPHVYSGGTA